MIDSSLHRPNPDSPSPVPAEEMSAVASHSVAQLRAIFDYTDQGLLVANLQGHFLFWNRAAMEMHALTSEEEYHAPIEVFAGIVQLLHEDGSPLPLSQWPLARILRGERLNNLELRAEHRGLGWRKTFTFGGSLVNDDAGRPILALVTVSDITERKRAELELVAREQHFRLLVEQAADGIFISDAEGRYLDVNSAGCAQLGYSREELLRLRVIDVIDPEEIPRFIPEVGRLADGGVVRTEWRFKRKDGTTFIGEVSARQLPDGRLQAFLRDVTERRRAESALLDKSRQLERMNEELELFALVASHDLKAPLRAISGLAALIEMDACDSLDDSSMSRLKTIQERVARMAQLIEGLLDYARVGAEARNHTAVSLRELIDNVVSDMAFPSTFRLHLAPELPELQADPLQLRQIFQNLLSNALHHHDLAEGNLWVDGGDVGEWWCVRVADDGPGIPHEVRERIFRMFATSRGDKGHTGIGLAVVRKLMLANGGRIEVSDNTPRGTVFRLFWPK